MQAKDEMAENDGFEALYARWFELVYRICFLYLKNPNDAEDAVSIVFLRILESAVQFASEEHEKAWLIVTTRNVCKNELRRKSRQHLSLDTIPEISTTGQEPDETLPVLLKLPEHYRTALYLYYYEGYSSKETARLMRKNESTIRTYLSRGRMLMKQRLSKSTERNQVCQYER